MHSYVYFQIKSNPITKPKLMKLFFTLFLTLFCNSIVFSQLDRQYTFTETSGTYTPVSGGTQIQLVAPLGVNAVVTPIGFNFNYMGVNYTTFSMATTDNGYWLYKCGYVVLGNNPLNGANRISSCEFQTNLQNCVTTKTEGLAPYRVCIIETNAPITTDPYCYQALYNNRPSQIRLYETSNIIELVYGNFLFNTNTGGEVRCGSTNVAVTVGLRNGPDSLMVSTAGKINWNNVALQAGGSYTGTKYHPPAGKIFRFTPNAATTCASSPITGGTAVVINNYVHKGEHVTIQVNGSSNSTALSYQWQQSADNNNWADIAGANKSILNRQITVNGWYRRKTTCEGGGTVYTSTPIEVKAKPFYESYCIPGYPYLTPTNSYNSHYLVRIEGTTLNSNSVASNYANQPYHLFPASGNTTGDLARGMAYNFKVNGMANTSAKAWLDLNRNGIYEPTEVIAGPFYLTLTPNGLERTYVFNYTIPPTVDTGLTGFRVSSYISGASNGIPSDACDFYTGFGETEDYAVRIVAFACTSAPTGGTTLTNKTSVCGTDSITLKVSGASGQEGISFQWQSSADSTNWNNISGATGDSLRTAQSITSFYRRRIACSSFENFSIPVKVSSIVLQGGTAAATVATHTCGQGEFAVTITGGTAGSYQWQQSADSIIWNNISGATAAILTTSATATGFYRRQVSCPGGNSAFSSGARVIVTAPMGGSAQAADSVHCGSNNILVTVNGSSYNTGLGFQWQSSPDGNNWTNINGASTDSLRTLLFSDTWYRRQTGCGSFTAFSTAKKVAIKAPLAGQATANAGSVNCGDSVTLGNTLNIAGHTYQWQQSSDSIAWNNINGATGSTYTARPIGTTWYRRSANCGGLGNVSVPVKVSFNAMDGGITNDIGSNYGCPVYQAIFSVSGGSIGSYQWQQSTDSTNWNDIPGATTAQIYYEPQQPVNWFRRKVTCVNGNFAFSVPSKIAYDGPSASYIVISPPFDTVSCSNPHIQLAAFGLLSGSTITFTWQKSLDSVSWVDVTPPLSVFYADIYPNVTAYYRCKTSCVSLSTYSNVKKIVVIGSASNNSTTVRGTGRICPGSSFTVTVTNAGDTTNATYQWQRSSNGSSWTDIGGATTSILTTSQTAPTWYRRRMTAACGNQQLFSAPLQLNMDPFYNCYCQPANTNGCNNATVVNVKMNEPAGSGAIVNPSSCNNAAPGGNGFNALPGGYIIFNPGPFRTTTLQRTETYNAEVTSQTNIATATAPWERADVFIDFNHNGLFDTNERFSRKLPRTSNPSVGLLGMEIRVPATAFTGITGMRVRYHADTLAAGACDILAYGETEDYTITIGTNPLPAIASGLPYNTCVTGTTVVIKNSNNNTNTWQKLYDVNGAVIAEVNARGNQLDTVKTSVYVNNGPVQQDLNGRFYLDRNVSIQPKVQPSSPVGVRLYLTAPELAALQAMDPLASINNLNITKVGADCPAQPNSNNTFVVTNSAQGYLGNYYLEFDVTTFSSFFMHRGDALISVLNSWQVQPQGYQNKLSWTTAVERNSSYFDVESSTDGLIFNKIGTVPSKAVNGNSIGTLSYNYTDGKAQAVTVYYRLKITDKQGSFTYSKVLQVMGNTIDQLTTGNLQPNPATNSTQLTVVAPGKTMLRLMITDQAGRVVQEQAVQLVRGENIITIQIGQLAKGMYLIKGICADGCNKLLQKLIKQ
jgi:GEVED domain